MYKLIKDICTSKEIIFYNFVRDEIITMQYEPSVELWRFNIQGYNSVVTGKEFTIEWIVRERLGKRVELIAMGEL